MFVEKTIAQLEAMTAEELQAYKTEEKAHNEAKTKSVIEAEVKAQVEKAKDVLGAEIDNQLTEKLADKSEKKETLLEVVKSNREKIDNSTRSKGNGQMTEFVVKADTLRASVTNNGYAMDLTDVGQYATRKLTVYDLFPKVPVAPNMNGVVRYVDWDTATLARAAAAVAEGATIPESTAKWATYTMALQKVGVTIPVSEEFTYDDRMFVTEVENFLRNDVSVKIDTDLINANGTAPNINGLINQATAYTAAASGITDASIYDLIVDVKRSITSAFGSKYAPDFALMNITDINKMLLKKDVNKQYVAPPFSQNSNGVGEFIVAGIRVIECNAITANQMVLGDSRYAKIYEEPGFVVATGYDGSDWSNDMMTLKARKRLNLLLRTVDRTGFAKVSSISAALTTLAS